MDKRTELSKKKKNRTAHHSSKHSSESVVKIVLLRRILQLKSLHRQEQNECKASSDFTKTEYTVRHIRELEQKKDGKHSNMKLI